MRISVFILAAVLSSAANADDEAKSQIRSALESLAPNAQVTSVEESPVPGVFEVTVGTQVLYMTGDGRYLLQGSLFDTETRTDLTARAMARLRKAALSDVDAAEQITFAPADGKVTHEVTVFTDIDCGYCRRLHSQIDEYNEYGIAVNYLFFPRSGPGSHSFEKAVSVWCADDSRTALTEAKQGAEPEPRTCENPVAAQFQLGQDVGIQGTPAIVAEDGTMLPGYMPPQTLVQRLDALAGADSVDGLKSASQ